MASQLLWDGGGEPEADIWFVHGLRGNLINTWSSGNICWPRDLLKVDAPKCRVFTWGYDSSVANVTQAASHATIFGHSESLLQDVCMSRTSEDEAKRPLVFVGHSLGGLVIKEALIRSSEYHFNKQDEELGAVYPCTKGVVFLGTPHRGSELTPYGHIVAKVAKLLLRNPNERLISLLESESPILERQRKSFASISKDIGLACVFEELPTALGIVVPEWSATIDGFNVRCQPIPANHIDMCRFANREEVGYKRVVFLLNNILKRKFQDSGRSGSTPVAAFHGWVTAQYNTTSFGPPVASSTTPQPPPLPPQYPPPPVGGAMSEANQGGAQRITGVLYTPTTSDAGPRQAADHKNAGRWEQARELEQRLFQEHQRTLGVAHITTLSAACDYTETTLSLGYLEDASRWADWVFGTGGSALGQKHPLMLKVNRIRGEVLVYQGEFQKAEELLRSTFVDQQDSLGSDHPDKLETERALGYTCHAMHRIPDAEARLRNRLEEMTRRLGENHIKVSAAAIDLVRVTLPASADLLGTINQFQQAAMVMDDVHKRLRASFGPQNQLTIQALRVHGHVKILQGETTEATDMLRRALSNSEALLGRDHPETIEVVALMVLLHAGQGGAASFGLLVSPAARGWCERYTTWLEQRRGLKNPETRSMLKVLGLSHMQERNYIEAEKYYERLVRSYQGMNSKDAQEANSMYEIIRMNTGLLRGQAFGGGGGQDLAGLFSRLGLFRN